MNRIPNFEMRREPVDVTSLSRPDEGWRHVDAHGHVHQWEWEDGQRSYRPGVKASVPTVKRIVTGHAIDEDGDEVDIAHLECVQCGDVVPSPGRTADTNRVFAPGLMELFVDGRAVTREEFIALAKQYYPDADLSEFGA